MKFEIHSHTRVFVQNKFLKTWLRRATALLKRQGISFGRKKTVVIVFVPVEQIVELNSRFRKKKYATDILSFGGVEADVLGELVLSPSVLRSQARDHGLLYREEVGYMLIHGLLHLVGYDHEKSAKEAREMFKIQDDVFGELCKTSAYVNTSRKQRNSKRPKKSSRKNARATGVSLTLRSKRVASRS